jgi:hypothetical protein
MEVTVQFDAPVALPPVKELPVPFDKEAWWASEPVWTIWRREKSYYVGNRTRTVQPIALPAELSLFIFRIIKNSEIKKLKRCKFSKIFRI